MDNMDGIFDILGQYWFFLLMLFWLLAGLFGRNKRQSDETDDSTQPQPVHPPPTDHQPSPSTRNTGFDRPWESASPIPAENQAERHTDHSDVFETPIQDRNRSKSLDEERAEVNVGPRELGDMKSIVEGQPTKSSSIRLSNQKQQRILDFTDLRAQDIVQGVVWAEVFGEPKARKKRRNPYSYRR